MAPVGGRYDSTATGITLVMGETSCIASSWAASAPTNDIVFAEVEECPLDDAREPIPYNWHYKPPVRMIGLPVRFLKPPNHMSGRQLYKEKRKARLQA